MAFEAWDLGPRVFLLLLVGFCAKIFTLQSSNSIRMLKKDLFIYGEKTVKRKNEYAPGELQLIGCFLLLHLQLSHARSYGLRNIKQGSMCLMLQQNAAVS